jgi:hypothetical protein
MRGLKRIRSAQVVCSGHAFVQNLRRGHYELGHDVEPSHRLEAIFTELAVAIWPSTARSLSPSHQTQQRPEARWGVVNGLVLQG